MKRFLILLPIVATSSLLTACASYKTPDELRMHTQHKISATIDAEHKKIFTGTLEYLRSCAERQYSGGLSTRVFGDFVGPTSQISVGTYTIYSPMISTVIDMSAAGDKTEVVIFGLPATPNEEILGNIKLIAAGKAAKCR